MTAASWSIQPSACSGILICLPCSSRWALLIIRSRCEQAEDNRSGSNESQRVGRGDVPVAHQRAARAIPHRFRWPNRNRAGTDWRCPYVFRHGRQLHLTRSHVSPSPARPCASLVSPAGYGCPCPLVDSFAVYVVPRHRAFCVEEGSHLARHEKRDCRSSLKMLFLI